MLELEWKRVIEQERGVNIWCWDDVITSMVEKDIDTTAPCINRSVRPAKCIQTIQSSLIYPNIIQSPPARQ